MPPEEDEALYLRATGDWGLSAEVEWAPDEDFSVAALSLATELSRQQRRGLNQRIDWKSVLARFEKGIRVAIDSTNKTAGALHLNGALAEVAGADVAPWYLTTDGLHYPDQTWYLPRWDIYRSEGHPANPLLMPVWADKTEWSYISRAAVDLYSK